MEELKPIHDGHKSFWGRAHVWRSRKTGAVILRSYETDVCFIDVGGAFHKVWDGFSRTTMRHIAEFVRQFAPGEGPLTKKAWEALPDEPWSVAADARDRLLSMEAK